VVATEGGRRIEVDVDADGFWILAEDREPGDVHPYLVG
jgi:hypothetical protein